MGLWGDGEMSSCTPNPTENTTPPSCHLSDLGHPEDVHWTREKSAAERTFFRDNWNPQVDGRPASSFQVPSSELDTISYPILYRHFWWWCTWSISVHCSCHVLCFPPFSWRPQVSHEGLRNCSCAQQWHVEQMCMAYPGLMPIPSSAMLMKD